MTGDRQTTVVAGSTVAVPEKYRAPVYFASLSRLCSDRMMRTVPERERMMSDSVVAADRV